MNIDHMLITLGGHDVRFLVLGGINFMLRHQPVLTFDLDVWVRPDQCNLARCEAALAALDAQWGETEATWGPVVKRAPGWLGHQAVYCMICDHGALDIFMAVKGLGEWDASYGDSVELRTAAGAVCRGLSDLDMLRCQQVLPEAERKLDRIRALEKALHHDR